MSFRLKWRLRKGLVSTTVPQSQVYHIKRRNMNRNIKKQFWLNCKEDKELKDKAMRTCLTEAGLLRFLITGFEPQEKPGDEFYLAMEELSVLADRLEAVVSYSCNGDEELRADLFDEILRWRKFQADIERRFLTPIDGREKWQ